MTDLSLNHTTPVSSHGADKIEDIDIPFPINPLQLVEEGDKSASPPYASTAVDNNWPRLCWV